MCIVTILPLSGGFVLTANRDEHRDRPSALPPQNHLIAERPVTFPCDPESGGTWIAGADDRAVCLLNGAFLNDDYFPEQPRRSRGLVVLDYLEYGDLYEFADRYNFGDIAPFTLLSLHPTDGTFELDELRWNGRRAHVRNLPPGFPHVWSSPTLYDLNMASRRKLLLADFLTRNRRYTAGQLLDFHRTAGVGDPANDYIMHRPEAGLRTVSISQIVHSGDGFVMHHESIDTKQ
jgi:Transport and Golgi organisation 2